MRFTSDSVSLYFDNDKIEVSNLSITSTIEPNMTWKTIPLERETDVTIHGSMKILEWNPRFWIVTPFEKIRYYLNKLRYKIMKCFGCLK